LELLLFFYTGCLALTPNLPLYLFLLSQLIPKVLNHELEQPADVFDLTQNFCQAMISTGAQGKQSFFFGNCINCVAFFFFFLQFFNVTFAGNTLVGSALFKNAYLA
jgi:hypothetical protein